MNHFQESKSKRTITLEEPFDSVDRLDRSMNRHLSMSRSDDECTVTAPKSPSDKPSHYLSVAWVGSRTACYALQNRRHITSVQLRDTRLGPHRTYLPGVYDITVQKAMILQESDALCTLYCLHNSRGRSPFSIRKTAYKFIQAAKPPANMCIITELAQLY